MKNKLLLVGSVTAMMVAGLPCSIAAQESTAPQRLKGMSQQIVVQKASTLKVTAPSGEYVAVLDQSGPLRDPKLSKIQDHNNGWLQLSTGEIEGDSLTLKGKYYVPISTADKPTGLRITVRRQTKTGIVVYADKTVPLASANVGRWVEIDTTVPVKKETDPLITGNLFVMLSAVPLAGPLYLDDLVISDVTGKPLWQYPSFE